MNLRRHCFLAFCLTLSLAASSAQAATRAVLIGTNNYNDHRHLPKLRFAANDVRKLARTLIESGCSPDDIVVLADDESGISNTFQNTLRTLKSELKKAKLGDSLLIVVAGHGLNRDGDSYLCPSDADVSKPVSTMLSVAKLYDMLVDCGASQKYLVIDACRNEEGLAENAQFNLLQGLKSMKSKQAGPQGVMCFASALSGQRSAEDSELEQGVFLHYFREGLSGLADFQGAGNRDSQVAPHEVFQFAFARTRQHTLSKFGVEQTPWFEGHATGDLVLATVAPARAAELAKLHRMPELPPSGEQLHAQREYTTALTALQRGDLDAVIAACTRALAYDSHFAMALRTRAMAYQIQGKFEAAISDLEKLGEPLLVSIQQPVDVKANTKIVAQARPGQSLEITSIQEEPTGQFVFDPQTGTSRPQQTTWLNVQAIHDSSDTTESGKSPHRVATNGWVKADSLANITSANDAIRKQQREHQQPYVASSVGTSFGRSSAGPTTADIIINNSVIPDAGGWKGWYNFGRQFSR